MQHDDPCIPVSEAALEPLVGNEAWQGEQSANRAWRLHPPNLPRARESARLLSAMEGRQPLRRNPLRYDCPGSGPLKSAMSPKT